MHSDIKLLCTAILQPLNVWNKYSDLLFAFLQMGKSWPLAVPSTTINQQFPQKMRKPVLQGG